VKLARNLLRIYHVPPRWFSRSGRGNTISCCSWDIPWDKQPVLFSIPNSNRMAAWGGGTPRDSRAAARHPTVFAYSVAKRNPTGHRALEWRNAPLRISLDETGCVKPKQIDS